MNQYTNNLIATNYGSSTTSFNAEKVERIEPDPLYPAGHFIFTEGNKSFEIEIILDPSSAQGIYPITDQPGGVSVKVDGVKAQGGHVHLTSSSASQAKLWDGNFCAILGQGIGANMILGKFRFAAVDL